MATAPWEESEELNEFPFTVEAELPPVQRGYCGRKLCAAPPHGSTQPGVSATSPAASPVMTAGAISHTSVRHEREEEEAFSP
ncbi:hypothetical protein FQA47_023785 [Oryzias melastigma]|uniref:Uncharacterized protein n=1 Tax=Oryzias melastigma TaxID=30732 RepID=A0A834EYM3_ORYME|nr:hypothetical protein FQA47_023785 [Oryzias melastigma]